MALTSVGTVATLRGDEERAERHFLDAAAIAADQDGQHRATVVGVRALPVRP